MQDCGIFSASAIGTPLIHWSLISESETSGADSEESEDSDSSSATMMSVAMSQVSSVTASMRKKPKSPSLKMPSPAEAGGDSESKVKVKSPSPVGPQEAEEPSPPVTEQLSPAVVVKEKTEPEPIVIAPSGSQAAALPAASSDVSAADGAMHIGGFLEQLTALKQAGVKEIPPDMRQTLRQLLLSTPAEAKPPVALPATPVTPVTPTPSTPIPAVPGDYGMGPCIPQMELNQGPLDVLVIEVEDPWMFWMQPFNPELEVLNAALE